MAWLIGGGRRVTLAVGQKATVIGPGRAHLPPARGVAVAFGCVIVLAFETALAGDRTTSRPKLTIVRNGPGLVVNLSGTISCGTRCSAQLPSGTLVRLTAASVDGSRFLGWTGACRGEVDRCALHLNGTAATTARFEPAMVDLDVVVGGAGRVTSEQAGIVCGNGAEDCQRAYVKHSIVRLHAAASPTSVFVGWAGACTGTGVCQPITTTSRSVRAVFRRLYAVSAIASGPGAIESGLWPGCELPCSALSSSAAVVPLTAVPASGALFDRWSGVCVGAAASCALATDAPASVTASFVTSKPIPLGVGPIIEVTAAGPGKVTGGGLSCGPTCAARPGVPAVLLTATAQPGAVFAGWGGDCVGVAPTCSVNLGTARAVTATFRRRYVLTVTPPHGKPSLTIAPPGTSCTGPCVVSERSDAVVTLSAAPAAGTANWGKACTGRGIVCTLAVDAPTTVPLSVLILTPRAQFTSFGLVVTLTRRGTVKRESGFVCTRISSPTTCSKNLQPGEPVQLVATPKARFIRWSGSCAGTKPTCSFAMNGTRIVIAHLRKP